MSFKETSARAAGVRGQRDLGVPPDTEKHAGARIAKALAEVFAEAAGIDARVGGLERHLTPLGGPSHFARCAGREFPADQTRVLRAEGGRFPPDEVKDFMSQDAITLARFAEERAIENDQAPVQEGGRVDFRTAGAKIRPELDGNRIANELDPRVSQFEVRRCGRR